ncbi:hypothetical protein CCP1ISM_1290004 [Azospirillaceae bacterium]
MKASIGTTKGDLISFSGAAAPVRYGVGADGSALKALAAATLGVRWGVSGDVTGPGSATLNYLAGYTDGTGKTLKAIAPAGAAVGLGSVTNDAQVKASIGTTKGDLITFTGAGAPVRIGVGADGSALQSVAAATTGLRFVAGGGAGDVTGPASSTANLLPRFSNGTGKALITSPISVTATGHIIPHANAISTIGKGGTGFAEIYLDDDWSTVHGTIFFSPTSKYIQQQNAYLVIDGTSLQIYNGNLDIRNGSIQCSVPYNNNVSGFGYYNVEAAGKYIPSVRYKKTVAYSNFNVGATSASYALMTMPAGAVLRDIYFNVSATFAGGAISMYQLSVGQFGSSATKHFLNNNVYSTVGLRASAASKGYRLIAGDSVINSYAATSTLMVTATSVGANLNAGTKGSADFFIRYDNVYNNL